MRTVIRRILAAYLLVVSVSCFAAEGLSQRINAIISQPAQSKVEFGVQVIEAKTGQVVYSRGAGKAMIPASNMKAVVSAAALKYLGADYQFKTRVGLCGGRLVVIGSGDPLLGDVVTDEKNGRVRGWLFEDIVEKLAQRQISQVKDIVVDSSIFDDERIHPNWPKDQLNRYYACEVSGINYNGNCIDISTKRAGSRVIISTEPNTRYVRITNNVKAISSGSGAVGSYRQTTPNEIIVFGKCKSVDGPFAVAIERPAAFLGYMLYEKLIDAGIGIQGQLIEGTSDDCSFEPIAEYYTPLKDCLNRCNKDSFGLAADAMLKTMGARINGGSRGSWSNGKEAIGKYLLSLGIGSDEFNIDDGRGLTRGNKLSPGAITRVFLDVYRSEDWQLYKDSLAVGGIDGTIGKYFRESKYKERIFGKTGYILGVKTFSGVCKTQQGDYIFSILTSGGNGGTRDAINDIAKAIIDSKLSVH
jgi:D-alanyl-D-alanine carboxypeptidase/D-alanyl-D-alanine-endopeptidase (penicillin-binding protein 4)